LKALFGCRENEGKEKESSKEGTDCLGGFWVLAENEAAKGVFGILAFNLIGFGFLHRFNPILSYDN
jgi:hypothetical protein